MKLLHILIGFFSIVGFLLTVTGLWGVHFQEPADYGPNIGAGIAIMAGPVFTFIGIVLWVVSVILYHRDKGTR